MPTVSNKTNRPISVPLPEGKTLHLGPRKTGQISPKAVEDARLKKLVEAGEIEISADDARASSASAGNKKYRSPESRRTSGSHRSGDR